MNNYSQFLLVVLQLVAQYGPGILKDIKALTSKEDATIEDVEAIFKDLKPYEAFGIPATVPKV